VLCHAPFISVMPIERSLMDSPEWSSTKIPLETGMQVAVIGCGFWGKNLVRCFAELGALAAVCDHDGATATSYGERYGVPAVEFAALLVSDTIDALVIAAPAALHAELAIAALDAGKHVFVEKPLALTISDAERVLECAAQNRRVLMVGHLLQYHPAFLAIKE